MKVNTFQEWLEENQAQEAIGAAAALWGAKKVYDIVKKRREEKKKKKKVDESEAPSTTVGSVGGGMVGEPPGPTRKKKKKCEVFAGYNVYEVASEVFMKCKGEKGRYDRYVKHVGDDEAGQGIREYGLKNPGKGIIIKDSKYGTMMVLRNGKGKHKKW
jgi:hypothetical protein